MGAGVWIAMILMMSLFWGAVIFAGIMIFRGTNNRSDRESVRSDRPTHRDPVDILDERFARGELDNEEYEARKAALLRSKR
ncbi:MAG: SHOCT domain-containing protein [Flavobacterium sp.]|nr:SHOCT domain-containing protein [Aeromicrobium sp.]